MKTNTNVKRIVESGILLALGYVLSIIKIKLNPAGGSITLVSMLPIVVLAYKYGVRWGTLCGFIHGLLQVIEEGGLFPPVQDFTSYVLVFLLDYILAWAVVGLIAGLMRNVSKKPYISIALGSFFGIAGRYLCSFTSGVIIWGVYAPEGQGAVIYSLLANGRIMIPEMIITAIAGYIMFRIPILQKALTVKGVLGK